jgi:hypothetical protein
MVFGSLYIRLGVPQRENVPNVSENLSSVLKDAAGPQKRWELYSLLLKTVQPPNDYTEYGSP